MTRRAINRGRVDARLVRAVSAGLGIDEIRSVESSAAVTWVDCYGGAHVLALALRWLWVDGVQRVRCVAQQVSIERQGVEGLPPCPPLPEQWRGAGGYPDRLVGGDPGIDDYTWQILVASCWKSEHGGDDIPCRSLDDNVVGARLFRAGLAETRGDEQWHVTRAAVEVVGAALREQTAGAST